MKIFTKYLLVFLTLLAYNVILAQQPTDCVNSVIVCGDSNINLDVNGIGTQELSGSNTCSSQENNSLWLQVTAATTGTLGFTLTPNSPAITEDYDFFIFGPNVPCSNIGQAIRCSTTNPQAAGQGNNLTGMDGTETDTAEGPGPNGNSFVRWLDVLAGETYFIVIDRPIGNSPFSLEWTGTAEFSDPPVNEADTSGVALDLESCDVLAPFDNGQTTFDLSSNTNSMIGAQTNVMVTYHDNISDANIGINPLNATSYVNITNPQLIFARITDTVTGCFETTVFSLDVSLGPNVIAPTLYRQCDNGLDGNASNGQVTFDLQTKSDEILFGLNPLDYNVTYHETLLDAESNVSPLPILYYNTTPNIQTLFVRVEVTINTNCASVFQFDLIVDSVPIANQPNDINICDNDNDGVWSFDFTVQDTQVLNGQNPATYEVKYFESQSDADANMNEIIGAYLNTINPKEIFVRIHNIGNPNCYDTTAFFIEVFDTPMANPISNIVECDDDLDGDNTNGQTDIDLTALVPTVLGAQNPADFTVTFHSSQADADTNNAALASPYYNVTPFSETIFVRIENNANTNCFDTNSFTYTVNPIPASLDEILIQCDEDGTLDGLTLFNLTQADDVITGGAADVATSFYLTLADAQNSTAAIDGTNFSNTVNPQIVFVQVADVNTGCFSVAELTLDVSVTNISDAILTTCDDDGTEDGLNEFTLTDADVIVLNGTPPDITLFYYETYDDALLEINPIGPTFTNNTAYSQIIYARAENANACYGISEVQLTVFELPDIEIAEDTIYCLNTFPDTITLTAGLNAGVPTDYTYLWSTGEMTHEIEINAPGSYTVTVTNANNCKKDRTITVLPSNTATFTDIEVTDASSNNTVTVIVSGEGDYEFSLDDPNGPYQDSNFFENVAAGLHTVYVRDKNDCGIVEQIVSIIGFPKYLTPNNDGYHDTWQVYGLTAQFQPNTKILIHDRYGKLLKQLDPLGDGWDGTFNGKPLPSNDYWFAITLQDGRVFQSHFTLKR